MTPNDDHEGDIPSRRTIIYTLTFETRIRYYVGIQDKKVINKTEVYYKDNDSLQNIEKQAIDTTISGATEPPYTETIDFFNEP